MVINKCQYFLSWLFPAIYNLMLNMLLILVFSIKEIPSRTLLQHFQWNKSLPVPCFDIIFNEINPQSYQILAFTMKWKPSHTLFLPFQWNKSWALAYFSIFNEINPQFHFFSAVLTKCSAVHYFRIFNEINPQPYLLLAISKK